jgi:hypothetical protein
MPHATITNLKATRPTSQSIEVTYNKNGNTLQYLLRKTGGEKYGQVAIYGLSDGSAYATAHKPASKLAKTNNTAQLLASTTIE